MKTKSLLLFVIFGLFQLSSSQEWRSYDGKGNNVANPLWGSEGTVYKKLAEYASRWAEGGVDGLVGDHSKVRSQIRYLYPQNVWLNADPTGANDFLSQFAQLPYLDMGRRAITCPYNASCSDPEIIRIPVNCDPELDPTCAGRNITMTRLLHLKGTGRNTTTERKSLIFGTPWLDLDFVYGHNNPMISQRRVNPPWNATRNPSKKGFVYDMDESAPEGSFRVTPTWVFANLFAWEHNRIAKELNATNPTWTEDQVFETARKWNIAYWQKISSRDYLAAATGRPIDTYKGYNATLEPKLDPLIRTVAARHGHHTVTDYQILLDEDFNPAKRHIIGHSELWGSWYSSLKTYYKEVIRGWIATSSWDIGSFQATNTITRFGTTDAISLDVLRSRDLGLPTYNEARRAFGYPPVTSFAQISRVGSVLERLRNISNNNVDELEAKWGMFAESRVDGTHMGQFAGDLLHLQFKNLRDSDRFWYEAPGMFSASELTTIYATTFSDIIQRAVQFKSGSILTPKLPPNPFFIPSRQPVAAQTILYPDTDFYANHKDLSANYRLSWTADQTAKIISFRLQVQTTGWVGIGWDAFNGTMKNADIILCRFLPNDAVECRDSLALDVGVPTLDTALGGTNDVINATGSKKNGINIFKFSRKFDTGDAVSDRPLRDGLQKVIFAYNPLTSELVYHGPSRSSATYINLIEKPTTAAPTTPAPTCSNSASSPLTIASSFFLSIVLMLAMFM